MVSGDEADALQVTNAEEPSFSAQYYLQVGITWPGLVRALERRLTLQADIAGPAGRS
jgi:hypothetical protein